MKTSTKITIKGNSNLNIKTKTKIKIKGDGQECPSHMSAYYLRHYSVSTRSAETRLK
jgi:hypothetical protein